MVPCTGSILSVNCSTTVIWSPRYECTNGLQMVGKETLFCDGHTWNGSVPFCAGDSYQSGRDWKQIQLIPSCTLSPSVGGESGRGLVLNLEARNPRSDILYNTGLLLQVRPVHFACNSIKRSMFPKYWGEPLFYIGGQSSSGGGNHSWWTTCRFQGVQEGQEHFHIHRFDPSMTMEWNMVYHLLLTSRIQRTHAGL